MTQILSLINILNRRLRAILYNELTHLRRDNSWILRWNQFAHTCWHKNQHLLQITKMARRLDHCHHLQKLYLLADKEVRGCGMSKNASELFWFLFWKTQLLLHQVPETLRHVNHLLPNNLSLDFIRRTAILQWVGINACSMTNRHFKIQVLANPFTCKQTKFEMEMTCVHLLSLIMWFAYKFVRVHLPEGVLKITRYDLITHSYISYLY